MNELEKIKFNSQFKILVVDDDEFLRDLLRESFEQEGYQTLVAENGKIALDIFREQKIDLVITDIRMPVMTGIQFIDSLRKTNVEIPILMFATGFDDISPAAAYDKGVSALFSKPFEIQEVCQTIHRCLISKDERWTSRAARMQVSFKVEVNQFIGNEKSGTNPLNIGQGGVFIEMNGPLPELSERVQFKIFDIDNPSIFATGLGLVRWIRRDPSNGLPRGFGLEFIEIDEPYRKNLIKIIEERGPTAFIPEK